MSVGPLQAFSLPIKIFGLKWHFGQEPKLCRDFAEASAISKPVVPFESLPTLVTFADLKDATSVKVVQPDQFETDFGPGYKFLAAKIAATTDAPITGLSRVLPWLWDTAPKDGRITVNSYRWLFGRLAYNAFESRK